MLYMVTFTINIPPMLAYIPYMDPMGNAKYNIVKQNDLGGEWWDVSDVSHFVPFFRGFCLDQ